MSPGPKMANHLLALLLDSAEGASDTINLIPTRALLVCVWAVERHAATTQVVIVSFAELLEIAGCAVGELAWIRGYEGVGTDAVEAGREGSDCV